MSLAPSRRLRLRLPRRRPRPQHLAIAAAVVVILLGGWLWVRDSALVRVDDVRISGATASDAARVEAALDDAARGMTTLHVDEGALRDAVSRYASVADVRATAHPLHRLDIEVVEHRAVAAVSAPGGERVAVTGSGLVLTGVQPDRGLPTVDTTPVGRRVTDRRALAILRVAGAAPGALLARTERLRWSGSGVVADLRDGPKLIFGPPTLTVRKWAAAARVLADRSSGGATYLDLRIPSRVAAGGLDPVTQEDADGDAEGTPEANPQLQGQADSNLNP